MYAPYRVAQSARRESWSRLVVSHGNGSTTGAKVDIRPAPRANKPVILIDGANISGSLALFIGVGTEDIVFGVCDHKLNVNRRKNAPSPIDFRSAPFSSDVHRLSTMWHDPPRQPIWRPMIFVASSLMSQFGST